jgi:hypothetical protein
MGARAVRDGLIARLDTIEGLRVSSRVPDQITPPAAMVKLDSLPFDSTMNRGSDDMRFIARVFTSKASDRGEDALYDYLDGSGAESIKAAVEADPTLDGVAHFAVVVEAREIGVSQSPDGTQYYTVDFVIDVGI